MRVSQLVDELAKLDPSMEVVVRISVDEDGPQPDVDDVVGAYADVTDWRNVSVEHGRAVIIGDLAVDA